MLRLKKAPKSPQIDLVTIRETISYMHDDVRNAPGLENVAIALQETLRQIDAASGGKGIASLLRPRFLPRFFAKRA